MSSRGLVEPLDSVISVDGVPIARMPASWAQALKSGVKELGAVENISGESELEYVDITSILDPPRAGRVTGCRLTLQVYLPAWSRPATDSLETRTPEGQRTTWRLE